MSPVISTWTAPLLKVNTFEVIAPPAINTPVEFPNGSALLTNPFNKVTVCMSKTLSYVPFKVVADKSPQLMLGTGAAQTAPAQTSPTRTAAAKTPGSLLPGPAIELMILDILFLLKGAPKHLFSHTA